MDTLNHGESYSIHEYNVVPAAAQQAAISYGNISDVRTSSYDITLTASNVRWASLLLNDESPPLARNTAPLRESSAKRLHCRLMISTQPHSKPGLEVNR